MDVILNQIIKQSNNAKLSKYTAFKREVNWNEFLIKGKKIGAHIGDPELFTFTSELPKIVIGITILLQCSCVIYLNCKVLYECNLYWYHTIF